MKLSILPSLKVKHNAIPLGALPQMGRRKYLIAIILWRKSLKPFITITCISLCALGGFHDTNEEVVGLLCHWLPLLLNEDESIYPALLWGQAI